MNFSKFYVTLAQQQFKCGASATPNKIHKLIVLWRDFIPLGIKEENCKSGIWNNSGMMSL